MIRVIRAIPAPESGKYLAIKACWVLIGGNRIDGQVIVQKICSYVSAYLQIFCGQRKKWRDRQF